MNQFAGEGRFSSQLYSWEPRDQIWEMNTYDKEGERSSIFDGQVKIGIPGQRQCQVQNHQSPGWVREPCLAQKTEAKPTCRAHLSSHASQSLVLAPTLTCVDLKGPN